MSSITNSSTRLAALVAGVAVALALMGAVAIAPAQAAGLSASQVQAIVSLLASFGADSATIANVTAALNGQATTGTSGGSAGACPVLTRSLSLGVTGADVMSLQQFLNASANTRVSVSGAGSPGLETMYFGPATQAAVVKFQAANNVSPIGVVGPATRAAIAAVCGTGSTGGNTGGNTGNTGSGTLNGGEADLGSLDLIAGDDLMEGDSNQEIALARFDVDGGDAQVQRVTLSLQASNSGLNQHPWEYIDSLAVYNGSTKVGSVDASSKSDWDQEDAVSGADFTSGVDYYTIDIPVSTIVREGDRAELSIRATAQDSIDDSDEDQTFAVKVPTDGIRAVDAKGIQQYTGNDSVTLGFNAAENGDITLRETTDNPDATVLVADSSDTSDEFTILAGQFKNDDDADATLNSLRFQIATSSAGSSTAAMDITDIIRTATVTVGGDDFDCDVVGNVTGADDTITENYVDCDDIDVTVDGNDTTDFSLAVELFAQEGHYAASGESITASIDSDDANAVDMEGADTGDASDVSGQVNGERQTIVTDAGIDVVGSTMSGTATQTQTSANSFGNFTLKFNVTANGDDVYVPKSVEALASTTSPGASTGVVVITDLNASSTSANVTVSMTSTADSENASAYVVHDGDTESFTVSVRIDPTATGFYQVGLDRVRFSDSANLTNLQTLDIDQTDNEFQTDSVSISN